MAKLSTILFKKRASRKDRFRKAYVDSLTGREHRPKKMGLVRTVFSACSLILGAGLCYVALHYIPAYMGTQKLLAMSTPEDAAIQINSENSIFGILSPYVDALRSRRTYLREGQAIRAQYVMPEGSTLKLTIRQCKPEFVVEIFDCEVVSERSELVKSGTVGTQKFVFKHAGFYTFDDSISLADGSGEYRVIWSRS